MIRTLLNFPGRPPTALERKIQDAIQRFHRRRTEGSRISATFDLAVVILRDEKTSSSVNLLPERFLALVETFENPCPKCGVESAPRIVIEPAVVAILRCNSCETERYYPATRGK